MNLKNLSIIAALTAIAITALNAPAHATAYRSAGGTYLELKEGGPNVNDVPGAIGTGRYKSGPWNGTFTSTTITSLPPTILNGHIEQESRKQYQGSFQAQHTTTGQVCTGQISIIHYAQGQGVGMVAADITWLNSSPGCSLINGGNPLHVGEPLPYTTAPDFDFTASVVNVLKSNTATWWRWHTTGPVNCRASASASSSIMHSFTAYYGDPLNARSPMSTGMGNGIVLASNGKPWLKVQNPSSPTTQCYVRASSNFILPVRLGF
jgi:hypothetical protein